MIIHAPENIKKGEDPSLHQASIRPKQVVQRAHADVNLFTESNHPHGPQNTLLQPCFRPPESCLWRALRINNGHRCSERNHSRADLRREQCSASRFLIIICSACPQLRSSPQTPRALWPP
jgi:hypothetical protein